MDDVLNKRVMQVMQHFDLSPSIFADEIGISRSKMSHIVNGRNKPSIEVLQCILTRYPDISSEWLLTGTGVILKDTPVTKQADSQIKASNGGEAAHTEPATVNQNVNEETNPPGSDHKSQIETEHRAIVSADKNIKRITVYYGDGTFEDFYSERQV